MTNIFTDDKTNVCAICTMDPSNGVMMERKNLLKILNKKKKNGEIHVFNLNNPINQFMFENGFENDKPAYFSDIELYLEKIGDIVEVPICRDCCLQLGLSDKKIGKARSKSIPSGHFSEIPSLITWFKNTPWVKEFFGGYRPEIPAYRNLNNLTGLKLIEQNLLPGEKLIDSDQSTSITNYRVYKYLNIKTSKGSGGGGFLQSIVNEVKSSIGEEINADINVCIILPFAEIEFLPTPHQDFTQGFWNIKFRGVNTRIRLQVPVKALMAAKNQSAWSNLSDENKITLSNSIHKIFIYMEGKYSVYKNDRTETYTVTIANPTTIDNIGIDILSPHDPTLAAAKKKIVIKTKHMNFIENPRLKKREKANSVNALACGICSRPITNWQHERLFPDMEIIGLLDKILKTPEWINSFATDDYLTSTIRQYGFPDLATYFQFQKMWVKDLIEIPLCLGCKERFAIGNPYYYQNGIIPRSNTCYHYQKSSTNILEELKTASPNFREFIAPHVMVQRFNEKKIKLWGLKLKKLPAMDNEFVNTALSWSEYESLGFKKIDVFPGEQIIEYKKKWDKTVILTNYRIMLFESLLKGFRNVPLIGLKLLAVKRGSADLIFEETGGTFSTNLLKDFSKENTQQVFNMSAWESLSPKDQEDLKMTAFQSEEIVKKEFGPKYHTLTYVVDKIKIVISSNGIFTAASAGVLINLND
jgi:hypothetical protein